MSKPKKFVVQLTDDDVRYLKKLRKKKSTSQTIANRCNILLAMDENHPPAKTYDQCVMACGVSRATIASTVKLYVEKGMDETLNSNEALIPIMPDVRQMVEQKQRLCRWLVNQCLKDIADGQFDYWKMN